MKHLPLIRVTIPVLLLAFTGCTTFGPEPETVDFVDVPSYMGLWHEIASNPQFFNEGLVNVTAEYALRDDGKVSVFNRGFVDGEEQTIEGYAEVVDTTTNSKLAVRFPSVFFGLFPGEYWIIALDEQYQWAVVSDSRQSSLFILSRTPAISRELYDQILALLAQADIDLSRLRVTGTIQES